VADSGIDYEITAAGAMPVLFIFAPVTVIILVLVVSCLILVQVQQLKSNKALICQHWLYLLLLPLVIWWQPI